MKLFSAKNTKIEKSDKSGKGYLTKILHLAPHDTAGCGSICPNSTPGCRASCLNTAGHGVYRTVQDCRIGKTQFFFSHKDEFIDLLIKEIGNARKLAHKKGLQLAVRLNGTSDIAWENVAPELFTCFPDVQFYDYTKDSKRVLNPKLSKNYYLTYSRSENDGRKKLQKILKSGKNVAVVYDLKPKQKMFGLDLDLGTVIVDGDLDDLRFLDPQGVIVGLRAKGKARKDVSGFVVKGA